MTGFASTIKEALAKKHAAQHPDIKVDDKDTKVKNNNVPAKSNKPMKKSIIFLLSILISSATCAQVSFGF